MRLEKLGSSSRIECFCCLPPVNISTIFNDAKVVGVVILRKILGLEEREEAGESRFKSFLGLAFEELDIDTFGQVVDGVGRIEDKRLFCEDDGGNGGNFVVFLPKDSLRVKFSDSLKESAQRGDRFKDRTRSLGGAGEDGEKFDEIIRGRWCETLVVPRLCNSHN